MVNSVLTPCLFLVSFYVDQGRYKILAKFAALFSVFVRYSPLTKANFKLLIQILALKVLFYNGEFDRFRVLARRLVKDTDDLYTRQPSALNHECLCLIQSEVVGMLHGTGHSAEAKVIWDRIQTINTFAPTTDPKHLAYVYDTLAYAAVNVGDYKTCLNYCNLGRENKQRAALESKVLEGGFGIHSARAHLELGDIAQAKVEVENGYHAWHSFLRDSAVVIADPFYIKGRIELATENYDRAKDWFKRALIIRQLRHNKQHPYIAQILEPYIYCLQKLGQADAADEMQLELTDIRKLHNLPTSENQYCPESKLVATTKQENSLSSSSAILAPPPSTVGKLPPLIKYIPRITIFLIIIWMLIKGSLFGALPEKVPENKTASQYYDLGVSYKLSGWTEQARESLEKAIVLDRGEIAIKAKRYLETKIPRYPVPQEAISMNIKGHNSSSIFTPGKAEDIWKECISKYPNFEWPYSNLGSLYVEEGKYKEAETLLNKAVEINPSYVNAWIHLAECKHREKDFAAEEACIQKADDLDADNPVVKIQKIIAKFH